MITVGILFSYLVALVILKICAGSAGTVDWRLILGIGAIPALIGLILRPRCRSRPAGCCGKGEYEGVQKPRSASSGPRCRCEDVEATARELERGRGAPSGATSGRRGCGAHCSSSAGSSSSSRSPASTSRCTTARKLIGPLFQNGNSKVDADHRRRRGHRDHDRRQRGGDVLRLPLHRQDRPSQARHRRLRRYGGCRRSSPRSASG